MPATTARPDAATAHFQAIYHGRPDQVGAVTRHQGWVWIECEDLGGPWRCQTDEERPHGLSIVGALAEEWGVDGGTSGRAVWARLTW